MASSSPRRVEILEITQVNPCSDSPNSGSQFSWPLTFFDIFWFKLPPVDSLFFYQLTDSTSTPSYFYSQILPKLKQSLSLTLAYYLPFAGKLRWPSHSPKPTVFYTPNDGVSVTVAQSNAQNFDSLSSNGINNKATELHPLVPELMMADDMAETLSVQVTLFPNQGFSIGFKVHHAVADGKSASMFVNSWAYLCKHINITMPENSSNPPCLPLHLTPFLDRSVVNDPDGLDMLYLNNWLSALGDEEDKRNLTPVPGFQEITDDLVRATLEFSPEIINKLKDKALSILGADQTTKQAHLSTFVLMIAYTVTCRVKARSLELGGGDDDRVIIVTFPADCRARLKPPLPTTYFGNCIISTANITTAASFMGEKGFAFAIKMVSGMVDKLKNEEVLEVVKNNVPDLSSLKTPDPTIQFISVAGSPRLGFYGSDFGLGRLNKVEIVSIDKTGAISITESSRYASGGVEIGLALKKHEMDHFIACLVSDGLTNITTCTTASSLIA